MVRKIYERHLSSNEDFESLDKMERIDFHAVNFSYTKKAINRKRASILMEKSRINCH